MLNIRYKEKTNAWPGFVDLFSNLVIILIFLLIVFLFLWTTTGIFNKNSGLRTVSELRHANAEQAALIEQMKNDSQEANNLLLKAREEINANEASIAEYKSSMADLSNAYESKLQNLENQTQNLQSQIQDLQKNRDLVNKYEHQIADLEKQVAQQKQEHDKLMNQISDLQNKLATQAEVQTNISAAETEKLQSERDNLLNQINELEEQLTEKSQLETQAAAAEIRKLQRDREALLQQIEDLQKQFASQEQEQTELSNAEIEKLQAALQSAKQEAAELHAQYVIMSDKLNKALADKIAELNEMAQYQSAFYKAIKDALGNRTIMRPDGDRFIISSDILFPSGKYTLSADGKKQLAAIAGVIKDFESKIDPKVKWIIRVDGHTDSKPVMPNTKGYTNNLQLSMLRANAVVEELAKNGVSKRRLVPSGFGDLHPIELGKDAAALQKNRRIELQLTNR